MCLDAKEFEIIHTNIACVTMPYVAV